MTNEPLPIEISVQQVSGLLESDEDFFLLDCREPMEREVACLERSTLIPMMDVPQRVAELEAYRDKRVVVHCHHGGRSLQVTEWLRAQGFAQAQNMTGGIDAWSQLIDPSIRRY